jgi:hypothetical protein
VTLTQIAAVVAPVVLLAGLVARAATVLARINQRLDALERRDAEQDDDLHDLGAAVHDHD